MNFTQWYLIIDNELKSLEQIVQSLDQHVYQQKEEIIDTYPDFQNIQDKKLHAPLTSNLPEDLSTHEMVNFHMKRQDFYRLQFTYPKIIWPSLFMSLFSFLEHILHQLCTAFSEGRPEYGNHSLLDRYKLFLKSQDLEFPDQEPEWAKIKFYKRLRDLIVHNRSHIESFRNNEKLNKQIKNEEYLKIENGYVILSPEFITESIHTYEKFYGKLFYD